MQNPNRLFRVINEIVFLLLGAFLALFAFTGRYVFFLISLLSSPRRFAWLMLSVVVILWGALAWHQAQPMGRDDRLVGRIAGSSLAIAGLIMLLLAWAPFRWAGWLLVGAGGVFVLRGLVSAAIMARSTWRLSQN
jgi:hypothetical protein